MSTAPQVPTDPMLPTRLAISDAASGLEPQLPEPFEDRLARVLAELSERLTGRATLEERLNALFEGLGVDPSRRRQYRSRSRAACWSVPCCRSTDRWGRESERFVRMTPVQFRQSSTTVLIVLIGQCGRCGTLHWTSR